MSQKIIKTVLAISGHVDNKFGEVADALMNVGSRIDALSQKVIDFGKKSTQVYASYDDVMREVQALGEYSDKTMQALDAYNRSVAQTSKYTMEQAASAEVLMAQLGLNMEQTRTLMPTVMNMAAAANIDLSNSLDYLYYSLNALGLPMEYASTLSDQMAKTAAISAADIDTLGMSLQRLGSGAQFFTGGSSEILAILGGIAQFGQDMQGSNAGTQLRNFMLTLLAPTKSKTTIMESLGVSESEWAEFEAYMEDAEINVTDTAAAMSELGLSVYDSTGKLKPGIQIIAELNASLASLDESRKNKLLGDLFGKRTTITASNLMKALTTIIDYQKQIEKNSAGYTSAMADTMEGGLGGSLRRLHTAWDSLKVTIGDSIAPEVGKAAALLTNTVNAISDMDDGKLNALVGAFEGIAAAGPLMLSAAGFFKILSFAVTPVGKISLVTAVLAGSIGAATKALNEWKQAKLEATFGEMELDDTALIAHVNAIGAAFESNYTNVNLFSEALNGAVTSYTDASATLSGELLTKAITGMKLTEAEKAEISDLGSSMANSLKDGINASFDTSASYLRMLFGGDNAANDKTYQDMILMNVQIKEKFVAEAASLGKEFGDALGAAMDDGVITGDEYNVIIEKMKKYNDAMAVAQDAERAGEISLLMHKAESVSWDSAKDFLSDQYEVMNQKLAEAEETHYRERGKQGKYYDYLISEGKATEEQKADALAELDKKYNELVAGYKEDNSNVVMEVVNALMGQSDVGDAYRLIRTVLGDMSQFESDSQGTLILDNIDWAGLDAEGLLPDNISSQLTAMSDASSSIIKLLKPYAEIMPEVDKFLEQLSYAFALGEDSQSYFWRKEEYAESGGTIDPFGEFSTPEQLAYKKKAELEASIADATGALAELQARDAKISAEIAERENRLAGNDRPWHYNLTGGEKDDYSALYGKNVLGGNLTQRKESITVAISEAEAQIAALQQELDSLTVPDVTIDTTGMEDDAQTAGAAVATSFMEGYGEPTLGATVDVMTISADAESAGKTALTALYKGWGTPFLRASVLFPGAQNTLGGVDELPLKQFAWGGRAEQASIFGEAGAEWAIPEAHTERTAQLFDMAREASGFTWPELIERNGGLNVGNTAPRQLIYSPTIIANDAAGVEKKLMEDKERLDSWWREKQLREDVEVYA